MYIQSTSAIDYREESYLTQGALHHYTKSEKVNEGSTESLVFFLVIIMFIKIDIMKFIGKLDNPSGEMG